MKKKNTTTSLPSSLISKDSGPNDIRFNLKFKKSTRKLQRKQDRIAKKSNKNKHSSLVKATEPSKSTPSKPKDSEKALKVKKVKVTAAPNTHNDEQRRAKQLREFERANPAMFEVLARQNLLETRIKTKTEVDADVEMYSKKLRLKEGKLTSKFKEDGLDFLLEGLDGGSLNEDQHLESDVSLSIENEILDDAADSDDLSREVEMESFEGESDEFIDSESLNDNLAIDSGAYVPPHLKLNDKQPFISPDFLKKQFTANKETRNSDAYIRLRKQIQGQLNRLSDANMNSIVIGIQDLYSVHRRHDISEITADLLLHYVGHHQNLLDSFVATYAAFITCLHHTINEFGAFFVQKLVCGLEIDGKRLVDMGGTTFLTSEEAILEVDSKQTPNYVSLLAFLYNFNQVGSSLIYDIIFVLLENVSEANIEILLRLLRVCGSKLRSDDPSALKEIILIMNGKFDSNSSVRCKYMMEFITNLKNNKKTHKADNAIQQDTLKKVITSVLKGTLNGTEALGCSLQDIKDVPIKGKWWLVGSAWKGNDDIEAISVTKNSTSLMELARSQKMNTDIRKSIFITLMSSEDCIDCHGKLLKLNLKNNNERDLIRVPLHCMQQQVTYNHYFTLVLQLLLQKHTHIVTYQYTLWDAIKKMETEGLQGAAHLAKCTANLFCSHSLPMQILKVHNSLKRRFLSPIRLLFNLDS